MKAIVVESDPSHSLVWREVPDPVPGPGEVLLRVAAAGVNRADFLQRLGLYPPPPGAPEWLGLEASGVIEAVTPGVTGWKAGDRACCLLAGGGYAEKIAVHGDLLLPIPAGVSLVEAASLPEAFATAWLTLVVEAELAPGEIVLIHAGASGVGHAAIQIARQCGARVWTTVGSDLKAARVRELGVEHAIVHTREPVTQRLKQLAETSVPGGIDVVLDCLGGGDLDEHLPLLNLGGRWILIAFLRGPLVLLDLRSILSRRLRIIGSTLRARPIDEKARLLRALESRVWPRLADGTIRTYLHAVLPIEEAAGAHEILKRRENLGKIVLQVRN